MKRAAQGNQRSGEQQLRLWEDDSPAPEWVEVDTANVRVENQLDFGGPWLALELIRKLKLDELLESGEVFGKGRESGTGYCLVLDQAEVSPDSKPSAKR